MIPNANSQVFIQQIWACIRNQQLKIYFAYLVTNNGITALKKHFSFLNTLSRTHLSLEWEEFNFPSSWLLEEFNIPSSQCFKRHWQSPQKQLNFPHGHLWLVLNKGTLTIYKSLIAETNSRERAAAKCNQTFHWICLSKMIFTQQHSVPWDGRLLNCKFWLRVLPGEAFPIFTWW